jgi:hypothetical protein
MARGVASDGRLCSALQAAPNSGGVGGGSGRQSGKKGSTGRPVKEASTKVGGDGETPLGLQLVVQQSGSTASQAKAPMLSFDARKEKFKALDLTLDVVASVSPDAPLHFLGEAISNRARAQVDAMVTMLKESVSISSGQVTACCFPVVQHFRSSSIPFPVTALFALPSDATISKLCGTCTTFAHFLNGVVFSAREGASLLLCWWY